MSDWLDALGSHEKAGEACVLVTVLDAEGSTPRGAGTKMVVDGDAGFGTIGGGHLEYEASAIARELLQGAGDTPQTRRFALGPSLGQCCGGAATLLFEVFRPAAFHIVLFGAGHVGRALVRVLAETDCRVTWVDSREDAFPAGVPANVTTVFSETPEDEVPDAAPGAHYLVMSHSHAIDLRICGAVLARGDMAWLGLIGSRSKRTSFERRLRARNIDPTRLTCPIGLPGLAGKRPAEIAIAVAAQLLAMRDAAREAATAVAENAHG